MNHHPHREPHQFGRRALLAFGALTAGGIALSPHRVAKDPQPVPSTSHSDAAFTPENSSWSAKDPLFTTHLKWGPNTLGAISKFEGAFPSVNVNSVLPLPGLLPANEHWFAVSVTGTKNQLQIVNSFTKTPIHILSIPQSHNGGIEAMVWSKASQILFVASGANLFSWIPSNPKNVKLIGQVEGATTLYDIQLDSQGNLWGGTYPNGAVFTYSPSDNEFTAHQRLALDSDYARRLAISSDDSVWVGTGALNPRMFTFPVSAPQQITEVALPDPLQNGFVSTINTIGQSLLTTASGLTHGLILDMPSLTWIKEIPTAWTSRKVSKQIPGSTQIYAVIKNHLHALDTTSWADIELGPVSANKPQVLLPSPSQVLIVSSNSQGLVIDYFELASNSVIETRAIELVPSEYKIQSLMAHSTGKIYVGAYMGKGLSAINPDNGVRWLSPPSEGLVNQIEGMIEFSPGRCYIGSYGSADIIGMDMHLQDSPDGYVRLERLSRKYHQSRPFGWAANSTHVFLGTVPDYGRSGGVLGMIDPATNSIEWILDGAGHGFIQGHSIIGLAADEKYVYGTTSLRNGYGLPDTKGAAIVFKLDIETKMIVWEGSPVSDAGALYAPKLVAGWLVVADAEGINVIDPDSGVLKARHRLTAVSNSRVRPGWAAADLAMVCNGSKIVHTASGTTTVVDFRSSTKSFIGDPSKERFGSRLTSTSDGRVFGYTNQTVLVEFGLQPAV